MSDSIFGDVDIDNLPEVSLRDGTYTFSIVDLKVHETKEHTNLIVNVKVVDDGEYEELETSVFLRVFPSITSNADIEALPYAERRKVVTTLERTRDFLRGVGIDPTNIPSDQLGILLEGRIFTADVKISGRFTNFTNVRSLDSDLDM